MQKTKFKKIVVYSHDTFGLGNIRRMLAITEHLLDNIPDLSILLISGSPMVHRFRLPEKRFDYLKLPCIGRTLEGDYIAKKLGTNFNELVSVRAKIIQAAVSNFRPDVMVVDKKPRGIADELQPTLDLIHNNMSTTNVVLLLRDILDDPQITQRIWQKNYYFQCIEQYYKSILVMGDEDVFNLCQEYHFPNKTAEKVVFCGYINRNYIPKKTATSFLFPVSDKPRVLVTVGGGEDGLAPLKHYLNGLKQYAQGNTFCTLIITGPEMSQRHREEIQNSAEPLNDVQVVEFTQDLSAHMKAADLMVSMAGYNTIVEILSMNKPAIIIPRVKPVQEQLIRATRMDKLGLLRCIHPNELTPEYLIEEVNAQLSKKKDGNAIGRIKFDGLETATRTIEALLDNGKERAAPNPQVASNLLTLAEKHTVVPCSVF